MRTKTSFQHELYSEDVDVISGRIKVYRFESTIKRTPGKNVRFVMLLTYYYVMSVPTLLRVRETWLIKEENSRVPASEMQFPGSILACCRNVLFIRYYLGRQIKISVLHDICALNQRVHTKQLLDAKHRIDFYEVMCCGNIIFEPLLKKEISWTSVDSNLSRVVSHLRVYW